MPRKARIKAESGIYHVMLRGINRQQIFEDGEDYRIFLRIINECKSVCGYQILAYCLMGNHVHLLIKEGEVSLGQVFKRIGVRYVYWYNSKYCRIGHLFQDRFKSETVNNEAYLYTVIRYIHQNPVKAGICKNAEDYPYSSLVEYSGKQVLVDMDYVEQYISKKSVLELSKGQAGEECMDINKPPIRRPTDQWVKAILQKMADCDSVSSFQSLTPDKQQNCVKELRKNGASIRQVCRLTGLNYYFVQKIK